VFEGIVAGEGRKAPICAQVGNEVLLQNSSIFSQQTVFATSFIREKTLKPIELRKYKCIVYPRMASAK
jgi:hypothetical protein